MTTNNTAVIRQLEREVDLLREENKGLRCQVERLREAGNAMYDGEDLSAMAWDLSDSETPAQSLAAVRAEAVEYAFSKFCRELEGDGKALFEADFWDAVKEIKNGGDNE